jgi:ABC-type antimicrobial peptide transport system permease subunit
MQNSSMENPYELLPAGERDAEQFSRPSVSYWQDAWRRLKKDKLAVFGMIFLTIVTLFAIFGPLFCPYEYDT